MLRVQLSGILSLALAWHGQGALVNYSKRHQPIRHETAEIQHISNASTPPLAQKEVVFLSKAPVAQQMKNTSRLRREAKDVWHSPNASSPLSAQKEVLFLYKAPASQKMKNVSRWHDGRQLEPGLPDAAEAFVQRSSTKRFRRHYEPRSAEDMELILGVPKIVWVILCDVVALIGFLSCIPLVMHLSREPDDDEEEEAKETEPGPCSSCPCAGSDGDGKEDTAAVDQSNVKTVI